MQPARVELEEAREGAGQVLPARAELEAAGEGAGQEREDRTAMNRRVFEDISKGLGFTGSFQKMFEQLRQENIDLKEYMCKMQKALDASDLEGTEKILLENESLRRHNEELTQKVTAKDDQIDISNDIVKELSDNGRQTEPAARNSNEGENTELRLENSDEGAVLEDEDVVLETEPKEDHASSGIKELLVMKNSGSTRECPQEQAKPKPAPRNSIMQNQNESYFKCDICKLVRNSKEKLERHMRNHQDEGDWTCDDCSYQSNEQHALLDHLLEKRHSSALLKHLLNQNLYERKDKCGFCNQIFNSKKQLLDHKKK